MIIADKKTFNVSEASKILGVSRSLMYRVIHKGELPIIKLGNRILISHYTIENILNENKGCDLDGKN